MSPDKFNPSVANLGKECQFWHGVDINTRLSLGIAAVGCQFPKAEMEGRKSCEGLIDDVCLYLKLGRIPKSLTEEQLNALRTRIPLTDNSEIPPGDIIE